MHILANGFPQPSPLDATFRGRRRERPKNNVLAERHVSNCQRLAGHPRLE